MVQPSIPRQEDTRSPMDRAKEFFDDISPEDIRIFGVQIKTITIVKEFIEFCSLPDEIKERCIENYLPNFNYARSDDDEEIAERASRLLNEDVLVNDVLEEFAKITDIGIDEWLTPVKPNIDLDFFWEICKNTTVLKYRAFALNDKDYAAEVAKQLVEFAESSAKIEAAEKLHKILMSD